MDDKSLEILKDAATAVAKEMYNDAGRPILNPTGETLGLIPRTVRAALLPLEKWVVGREYNLAVTKKLLELKLQNVAPEQIVTPEAYIGVPALQYISYCMDSEELRDMYANLLAKSMNEVTRNGVHPSFVEIIKQLCPDEAKILRIVSGIIPVITLRKENAKYEGIDVLRNFSDISEKAKCEHPDNIPQYLDNLERLGIINNALTLSSLVDKSIYDPLKNHPSIKELEAFYSTELGEEQSIRIQEGYFYLSNFGRSFKKVCITPIDTTTTI